MTAVGSALTGPSFSAAPGAPPAAAFQYGVASGDSLPDGVVTWTRVTPSPAATLGPGEGAPTKVTWLMAEDADLKRGVRRGAVTTSPLTDHTVTVDVRGLQPGRACFYGFTALKASSLIGGTRTAPAADALNASLRIGTVSC